MWHWFVQTVPRGAPCFLAAAGRQLRMARLGRSLPTLSLLQCSIQTDPTGCRRQWPRRTLPTHERSRSQRPASTCPAPSYAGSANTTGFAPSRRCHAPHRAPRRRLRAYDERRGLGNGSCAQPRSVGAGDGRCGASGPRMFGWHQAEIGHESGLFVRQTSRVTDNRHLSFHREATHKDEGTGLEWSGRQASRRRSPLAGFGLPAHPLCVWRRTLP
jgi:hypothetical protein